MQETELPETEVKETLPVIVGPDFKPLELTKKLQKRLVLAAEKFDRPNKHYRLIWTLAGEAWLCEEDKEHYRTVSKPGGALEAGRKLAGELGVKFDERVR